MDPIHILLKISSCRYCTWLQRTCFYIYDFYLSMQFQELDRDQIPEEYRECNHIHELISCKIIDQMFHKNRAHFRKHRLDENHIATIKALIKGEVLYQSEWYFLKLMLQSFLQRDSGFLADKKFLYEVCLNSSAHPFLECEILLLCRLWQTNLMRLMWISGTTSPVIAMAWESSMALTCGMFRYIVLECVSCTGFYYIGGCLRRLRLKNGTVNFT